MNLEELQKNIEGYTQNTKKLPRAKHAVIELGADKEYLDICVLSNVMIGLSGPHISTAKEEKPFRINKFKAHIEELKNDPNAKVVLGGDLFYFPGGSAKYREWYEPSYDNQVELMAELLAPIKDKIIGAYDGTEEIKIFEKDHINMTQKLMESLGRPNLYFGQMAEIDLVFKNKRTNNAPKTVNMLFDHGFLAANVTNTVAKKTEDLRKKVEGKDFYISSHYGKLVIEKIANLVPEGNVDNMVKKPCYFISVGGYRDFPNRLTSNRNVSPSNTSNGVIRITVVPNPDRRNIRGHNYVGEVPFKVCQQFINFGSLQSEHIDFDLCEEISRLNEENILLKDAIMQAISEKIDEVNKENQEILLEKYYGENNRREHKKARKNKPITKEAVETVVIKERGE